MRSWVGGAALIIGLALTGPVSAAPPEIAWRLDNPFPYFLRAADFDRYAVAAGTKSVLATERALAKQTGGWGWAEWLVDTEIKSRHERLREDACWWNANAVCKYHMRAPEAYAIRLSVPDVSAPCAWRVANEPPITSSNCSKAITAKVPAGGARITVDVERPSLSLTTETGAIKRFVVAGLGDSYASGQGNPDYAVRYDRTDYVDYGRGVGYPARAGALEAVRATRREPARAALDATDVRRTEFEQFSAKWVQQSCHRSLYSHQLRAALQLAVGNPKAEYVFVGLSCNAATIPEGLLGPGGGAEPTGETSSHRVTLSQVDGLARAMCKRFTGDPATCADGTVTPDLVLLSIGGNDVGFSRLVQYVAASRIDEFSEYVLKQFFSGRSALTPNQARPYLKELVNEDEAVGGYAKLGKALTAALGNDISGRVLLTAYPHLVYDQAGNACGNVPNSKGMRVANFFAIDGQRGKAAEAFGQEMTDEMRKATKTRGWGFSESIRTTAVFKPHGMCADADAFYNLPKKRFCEPGPGCRPRFRPIGPADYRPYRTQTTWMRLPDDAFMASNTHLGENVALDEIGIASLVAASGVFHPTAEGHAAMADAVLKDLCAADRRVGDTAAGRWPGCKP